MECDRVHLFRTMRIRLLKGRTIQASDTASSRSVVVINESAAQKFFPNEDPIGKRVKQGWPEWKGPWREVVGVVADVKQNGLDAEQRTDIFLPHTQEVWNAMNVVVRSATPPSSIISAVRGALYELDKGVAVY